MKTSYKRLKAALVLRIRKLVLFFLILELEKFLLFDNIFLDLANFWDLANFLLFDFF